MEGAISPNMPQQRLTLGKPGVVAGWLRRILEEAPGSQFSTVVLIKVRATNCLAELKHFVVLERTDLTHPEPELSFGCWQQSPTTPNAGSTDSGHNNLTQLRYSTRLRKDSRV